MFSTVDFLERSLVIADTLWEHERDFKTEPTKLMNRADAPIVKDLVLIGGGHSHVAVLKKFGMKPVPGLRLTLITRDVHTPYSGMLPGYIAGHYDYDDAHIDLRPLARFAGCRLVHAEANGIDLENKRVLFSDRPALPYDVLSINIGSRPHAVDVPGANELTLPIKPIDQFLAGWEVLRHRVLSARERFRIIVVGGGAGGVELALCTQHRLQNVLTGPGASATKIEFVLLTDTDQILPTHNPRVRRKFERVLAERSIRFHTNHKVLEVEPGLVRCAGAKTFACDVIFWVTHAAVASWLRTSGLETDEQGFVRVNDCLQSVSHPDVFAAGDIAAMTNHWRPKSGVFAVRHGPPLAKNLRRAVLGRPLRPFTPQTKFLSLISTGNKYAVASRSFWSLEGSWVWRIKDWIDRRFMRKYNDLPEMKTGDKPTIDPGLVGREALKELSAIAMRCGGCGAKVGSTVLSRVINQLQPVTRDDVLVGLQDPDDAAVVAVPPDKVMVQTVDYFRAFLDDAYIFGKIAANHSLGDIFAMGADPQSAMAIATVPFASEAIVEEQLYQMMSGALEVLQETNTSLVGGHSSEGTELSFGLAVTGIADRATLMRKRGMKPAEALILTKPLGTGTLFAADMQHKAKGRWIDAAIASMLISNQAAAKCLQRYGVNACTDITGFGLLGHLVEMTRPSRIDVELELDGLPVLDGALDTIGMGIFSSLQPQNIRLRRAIRNPEDVVKHPFYPLLFDPQTAGGLLAAVAQENAKPCLDELHRLGYSQATLIGRTLQQRDTPEPITVWVRANLN